MLVVTRSCRKATRRQGWPLKSPGGQSSPCSKRDACSHPRVVWTYPSPLIDQYLGHINNTQLPGSSIIDHRITITCELYTLILYPPLTSRPVGPGSFGCIRWQLIVNWLGAIQLARRRGRSSQLRQGHLVWHLCCIHGRRLPLTDTGRLTCARRRSLNPGKGALPSFLPSSAHEPYACSDTHKYACNGHTDSCTDLCPRR